MILFMNMKKGDKITMLFHAFGSVSEEEYSIVELSDDEITIDDTFGPNDELRKFNRKTGKCLNDTNSFGAYRTIKLN